VQKRAARFAYNNYRSKEPGCVTNMLDTLNWEPLSQRRAKNSHHAIQDHQQPSDYRPKHILKQK
jgi:hypothetical protein